jgi:Glycosyl transferase family 2
MKGLTLRPSQEPVFAALVRTTGARNQSLLEALQSLALQSQPCLAVVIVHSGDEAYARVQELCGKTSLVHVLHAPNSDPRRKRGYPINVGIDYCLNHEANIRYVFLLDDDDIVYPFFTGMMAAAFDASQADVVYAMANRREERKPLVRAYPLRPFYHLLDQNFIPSNSYAIRADALRRSGVRVDEDLESLEDWLFLLRLMENKLRFYALDATLSEFCSESAADHAYRHDLQVWKSNALRVRRYINTTMFPVPGAELAGLTEAPPSPGDSGGSSTTAALRRRIWELEHSFSWKCTAPVRAVAGGLLRLRSRLKART